MRALYEESARKTRRTGIPHSVDHVIPCFGRAVCGLHVPENLCVVTLRENIEKGDSFVDGAYAAPAAVDAPIQLALPISERITHIGEYRTQDGVWHDFLADDDTDGDTDDDGSTFGEWWNSPAVVAIRFAIRSAASR